MSWVWGYCWGVGWARAAAALIRGTGRPGAGIAELRMAETTVAALQSGWADRRRAATPAARGAEALVPMACMYWVWPRLKQPRLWPF